MFDMHISHTTRRFALHAVFLLLGIFLFAGVAEAQQGFVPADCDDPLKCGFDEFMQLIKNIINFVLLIAIPVATALFVYAGFIFIFHASNPGERSKAKKIFWNVFIGLVISLTAWLIVNFISTLLFQGLDGQNVDDPFKGGMIDSTYEYEIV